MFYVDSDKISCSPTKFARHQQRSRHAFTIHFPEGLLTNSAIPVFSSFFFFPFRVNPDL